MPDSPHHILFEKLPSIAGKLENKRVTMGFDGFVDSVVRIVSPGEGQPPGESFFTSSAVFAQYILDKQSKSFSLELKEYTSKPGGNMPIMANALANLGPHLSCIGAFGVPEIHPVFRTMPETCELLSFTNPGACIAFEFGQNKMMMAEMQRLNETTWSTLKDVLGLPRLRELFTNRDLIGLLNWSEMQHSTDIWEGLLLDVLPASPPQSRPIGFFDLSDCSKKNPAKILEALDLLRAFANYWNVTLGMNMNEAGVLYRVITNSNDSFPAQTMGDLLYHHLGIHQIVIHDATAATCWNQLGVISMPSIVAKSPQIITGAGDNFNAGFCAGMLMELDTAASLSLGHTVSNYYLVHGASPCMKQLTSVTV